jgi:hypothetical protein
MQRQQTILHPYENYITEEKTTEWQPQYKQFAGNLANTMGCIPVLCTSRYVFRRIWLYDAMLGSMRDQLTIFDNHDII